MKMADSLLGLVWVKLCMFSGLPRPKLKLSKQFLTIIEQPFLNYRLPRPLFNTPTFELEKTGENISLQGESTVQFNTEHTMHISY